MTKEIQLTQGQVALVDDWWFDELNQYKWFAWWSKNNKSYYAVRNLYINADKSLSVKMHSVIANTPKGMFTDHINMNTLDNREENLRVCTNAQNQQNKKKYANNSSGYKGVTKSRDRWKCEISVNGSRKHIGVFLSPVEAAKAYDKVAREYHGEFANLNFPD